MAIIGQVENVATPILAVPLFIVHQGVLVTWINMKNRRLSKERRNRIMSVTPNVK